MNCKPGDLAILVRVSKDTEDNLGRIFEVLERSGESTYKAAFGISEPMPRWWCRAVGGKVRDWAGHYFQEIAIPDFALRPIRPGDISDEEVRELYSPKVPETA